MSAELGNMAVEMRGEHRGAKNSAYRKCHIAKRMIFNCNWRNERTVTASRNFSKRKMISGVISPIPI